MNPPKTWPTKFSCRFIEPGLISYEDINAGKVFVSKEALDKMANSFVGRPVLDMRHDDVSPEQFKEKAAGVVTGVRYNDQDGWYYADFLSWDEACTEHCKSGKFSVSCAYMPTQVDTKGGARNNIRFDQEVLNGEYTHLAIVARPRYNGAKIFLNSIGGHMLKLWPFGKGSKKELTNNIDVETALIDIDGQQVPLKDIIAVFKAEQAEMAAQAAAKAGADGAVEVGEESTVEVDGKPVPIKDMANSYRAKMLKNAEDEKAKKEAEEKAAKEKADADAKAAEEKKNAEAAEAEKKKKEEEDAAAKKAADEAAKKAEEEKRNEASKKHFKALENASGKSGQAGEHKVVTVEERRKLGSERYSTVVEQ